MFLSQRLIKPSIICPLICCVELEPVAWFTAPSPPLTFCPPELFRPQDTNTEVGNTNQLLWDCRSVSRTPFIHLVLQGVTHQTSAAVCFHIFSFHWHSEKQWLQVSSVLTWWRCSFNYSTDLSAYSLWRSMLVFDSGGLVWAILTGGRWASALAGRTGTWLSIPKLSAAAVLWSHGLAVFYTHTKTPLLFCSWQKLCEETCGQPIMGAGLLCALDTRVWLAGCFINTSFFIRQHSWKKQLYFSFD